jgi:hypothetical protein
MRSVKSGLLVRGTLALACVLSVVAGPLAGAAHADSGWCRSTLMLATYPVNNNVCVVHTTGRGFRGFIEFSLPRGREYQFAGIFFVTLTRNGNRVAKGPDLRNPIVTDRDTWPTPYAQTRRGTYCVRVWERTTPTESQLLSRFCHALP